MAVAALAIAQLASTILVNNATAAANEIKAHAAETQAKMMYEMLLNRTGSTSTDEFVERYLEKFVYI
jgi:hypothetical protein